jgi:hypothetical protein
VRVGGDPFAMPTDDKLTADAASLVDQYVHFWDKGEVECAVVLCRPGSLRPIIAYSEMTKERLMKLLQLCEAEQVLRAQRTLMAKGVMKR